MDHRWRHVHRHQQRGFERHGGHRTGEVVKVVIVVHGRGGFRRIPRGVAIMPGPVDPARLLVCELADGAFEGVSGAIRPDWSAPEVINL